MEICTDSCVFRQKAFFSKIQILFHLVLPSFLDSSTLADFLLLVPESSRLLLHRFLVQKNAKPGHVSSGQRSPSPHLYKVKSHDNIEVDLDSVHILHMAHKSSISSCFSCHYGIAEFAHKCAIVLLGLHCLWHVLT